jgi:hypothetical protein
MWKIRWFRWTVKSLVVILAILLICLFALNRWLASGGLDSQLQNVAANVEQKLQRKLTWQAAPVATLFPPRLELAGIALGEINSSTAQFISIGSVAIGVSWRDAMNKNIVLTSIDVDRLKVNLIRKQDGTTNIDDLLANPSPTMTLPFTAGAIKLKNSHIHLLDEPSKQTVAFEKVNVELNQLKLNAPLTLNLAADGVSDKTRVNITMASQLTLDSTNDRITLDATSVNAKIVAHPDASLINAQIDINAQSFISQRKGLGQTWAGVKVQYQTRSAQNGAYTKLIGQIESGATRGGNTALIGNDYAWQSTSTTSDTLNIHLQAPLIAIANAARKGDSNKAEVLHVGSEQAKLALQWATPAHKDDKENKASTQWLLDYQGSAGWDSQAVGMQGNWQLIMKTGAEKSTEKNPGQTVNATPSEPTQTQVEAPLVAQGRGSATYQLSTQQLAFNFTPLGLQSRHASLPAPIALVGGTNILSDFKRKTTAIAFSGDGLPLATQGAKPSTKTAFKFNAKLFHTTPIASRIYAQIDSLDASHWLTKPPKPALNPPSDKAAKIDKNKALEQVVREIVNTLKAVDIGGIVEINELIFEQNRAQGVRVEITP